MSSSLQVYDGNREQIAIDLHQQIERFAEQYAEAGLALMKMRDGEFYKDLPGFHYHTFEEYVGAVRELTVRHGRRLITASLVHQCLTSGGTKNVPPSLNQCLTLTEGDHALVGFKTKSTPQPQGGVKKVPVEVRNVDQVRRIWGDVCEAYEEQRARDLKEHPEKPPRKFTASFVNQNLPNQYRNEALIKVRSSKIFERAVGKISKVAGYIEENDMQSFEGMKLVSEKDGWSKDERKQFAEALRELKQLIDGAIEAINRVRV